MSGNKNVLIVDRTGRGHALVELFLRTNPGVSVHYVPGTGGMKDKRITVRPDLSWSDVGQVASYALSAGIDLALVSNPLALAAGQVDALEAAGIRTLGPSQSVSRLETSKSFAKGICSRYGIRTAPYRVFGNKDEAMRYVEQKAEGCVVKADGLCGGAGSFVCRTPRDSMAAVELLMGQRIYAESGDTVLVEEIVPGVEVSIFLLLDGREIVMLPTALDYKRTDDGNRGPNSGGMGSFSPHPLEGPALTALVREQLMGPLKTALSSEGLFYRGILYVGAMINEGQLTVLEFNARIGDPEAEVILPRISSDFVTTCDDMLAGRLSEESIRIEDMFCCDVVAVQGPTLRGGDGASNVDWFPGYPFGEFGRGYQVRGVEDVDRGSCRVFIGETADDNILGLVTDGGRIVHVVGIGRSKAAAIEAAYSNLEKITFSGMRVRRDIGAVYVDETLVSEGELRDLVFGPGGLAASKST